MIESIYNGKIFGGCTFYDAVRDVYGKNEEKDKNA